MRARDPAQIDDIIDMAEIVNIGGAHINGQHKRVGRDKIRRVNFAHTPPNTRRAYASRALNFASRLSTLVVQPRKIQEFA